jgi:beta-lactamase superfamily II metal-dependent hydrolase
MAKLQFVFWDVQHGSAAYMATPAGQHIAIDLGTGSLGSGSEFSPLLHLKNNWGVNQLDAVIITHAHRDHLDDVHNFDSLKPRVLHRPKHLSEEDIRKGNQSTDKDIIDKYLEIDNRYSASVEESNNPLLAINNGGVEFRFFTTKSCATSNLNNHCLVSVISYEGNKIIFPGDIEPPAWNELLEKDVFIKAIANTDILVAPHHGRESAYSSELFKYINPYLTIISDGKSETSAVNLYSQKTRGWTAYKRSGGSEERKCITTRSDGVITLEFGKNSNGQPYIHATIN